jgi:hypothetical protein
MTTVDAVVSPSQPVASTEGTPVAWYTRAWLVAEVLFGVLAVLSITLFPDQTATGFAWPISTVVMAAVLGGFYLTTAIILTLAMLARKWEVARLVVLPAIGFTMIELLATLLHWDKFSVGTAPFYIWFASYLLPPPIFLIVYLLQQRKAAPRSNDEPLPKVLRWFLAILGGLFVIEAVVSFIYPPYFMGSFPWALTPLTTRALSGWFMSAGGVMLAVAYENNRTRVRIAGPYLALMLPILAVQIARFPQEVDFSHPRIYSGIVMLGLMSLAGIYLSLGDWRKTMS